MSGRVHRSRRSQPGIRLAAYACKESVQRVHLLRREFSDSRDRSFVHLNRLSCRGRVPSFLEYVSCCRVIVLLFYPPFLHSSLYFVGAIPSRTSVATKSRSRPLRP